MVTRSVYWLGFKKCSLEVLGCTWLLRAKSFPYLGIPSADKCPRPQVLGCMWLLRAKSFPYLGISSADKCPRPRQLTLQH